MKKISMLLLIFSLLFLEISALKCLQGIYNTTLENKYREVECPNSNETVCALTYFFESSLASFQCSSFYCIPNGAAFRESICFTGPSFQKNCCCYTDGCSSLFLPIITNNKSFITTTPTPITTTNGVTKNFSTTTVPFGNPKPPTTSPLKCLQGNMNTSYSSVYTPTSCSDPFAVTCRSQYDASSEFSIFSCSNSNCSLNGQSISTNFCINITTTQTNCCCYGDGCNSKYLPGKTNITSLNTISTTPKMPLTTPMPTFLWFVGANLTTATIPKMPSLMTSNLKCIQGLWDTTAPLTLMATPCSGSTSITCLMKYNTFSKFASLSCSTFNCTIDGEDTRDSVCVNSTATGIQRNCCCYGDDCTSKFFQEITNNSLISTTPSTKPFTTPKPSTVIFANVTKGVSDNLNITTTSSTTLTTTKMPSTNILKCLQGTVLAYRATSCLDPYAVTCRSEYNTSIGITFFSCSNSNCTLNGQTTNSRVCVNVSSSHTNCCCYGDGCNLPSYNFNITTTSSTPLTTTKMPSSSTNFKCLQGLVNYTFPLTLIPTSCLDPKAITCIRQHDSYSKFATYSCSNSNCTINGQFYRNPICVNVSTYHTNCCCYGDACNLNAFPEITNISLDTTSTKPVLSFTTPQPSSSAFGANITKNDILNVSTSTSKPLLSSNLKCLQGSVNYTFPLTTIPTSCLDPYAVTCGSQYDSYSKFITFSCNNYNCSLNGQSISTNFCVNISSSQTNCCCYGDGCNSKYFPSSTNITSLSNTNKTTFSNSTISVKDQSTGCDESGFKILSTAADPSMLKGKFAGYLGFRSSCQQLCEKSFGLIKCFAYIYEQNNHGKCTIFQQPFEDEKIVESSGSNVVVSKKC